MQARSLGPYPGYGGVMSSRAVCDRLVSTLRPFTFRGKLRLLQTIVRYRDVQSFDLFGCRVDLDLTDHIQRNIYFGTYECTETELVKTYLRPGMTVIDVGANIGYYTMLAARLVREQGK